MNKRHKESSPRRPVPVVVTAQELSKQEPVLNLRDAFGLRQDQLLATLGLGQSFGGHPVTIGDSSELNWRGMLESVLPTRYRVSKAFVVDAHGSKSEQIDLLIYDRHFSPVLLDIGDYPFVPAEAVYAVLEVKQVVSKATIEYAANKVTSVRKLHRTSAPVRHAGGVFEPSPPHHIVGGLIATKSIWTKPFGDAVARAMRKSTALAPLDLICALSSGTVECREDGTRSISAADTALIFMVLRLLHRLQQLASVPAIDYDEYTRSLSLPDDPG